MSLWRNLEEIEDFFGPTGNYDDDLTDDPADVDLPQSDNVVGQTVIEPEYADALNDAPSNVYLTDKAREALHGDPIRAYERQQSLVAAGDPHALEIAEACCRWLAAQKDLSIDMQKGA
jgi:hypothetical protein